MAAMVLPPSSAPLAPPPSSAPPSSPLPPPPPPPPPPLPLPIIYDMWIARANFFMTRDPRTAPLSERLVVRKNYPKANPQLRRGMPVRLQSLHFTWCSIKLLSDETTL